MVALVCAVFIACSSPSRNDSVPGSDNTCVGQATPNPTIGNNLSGNAGTWPSTQVAPRAATSSLNNARLRAMYNRVGSAFATIVRNLKIFHKDRMSPPLVPTIHSMTTLLLLNYIVRYRPNFLNQAVWTLAQYIAEYPACVLAMKNVYSVVLFVNYRI